MKRMIVIAEILLSLSSLCLAHSEGMGNQNYCNTPTTPRNCSACHSGNPVNSTIGTMSVAGYPINGYIPGQTYNIIVTLRQIRMYRWGMQATILNTQTPATRGGTVSSSNTNVSVSTDTTAARDFVNQTTAGNFRGTATGPVTWQFTWQAPPVLSGPMLLYICGLACNNNGDQTGEYAYTRVDTIREFAGQMPPNFFSLRTPPPDTFIGSQPVALSWETNGDPNAGDIVSYKVFTSTDSLFRTRDSTDAIDGGSAQISIFQNGVRNFWKVRAYDNHGNARWSNEAFSILMDVSRPPEPFDLVEPNGRITDHRIVFRWRRAIDPNPEDTVTYTVTKWMLNYPDFRDSVMIDRDTTYTTTLQIEETPYVWSVRATDNHGNSTLVSSNGIFYISNPLPPTGQIELLTPSNSSIASWEAMHFSWTTLIDPNYADSVEYRLWLKIDHDSTSIPRSSENNLDFNVATLPFFQIGQSISWWVTGHSSFPDTTIESTQRFTIAPNTGVKNEVSLPTSIKISEPYPNPFNAETALILTLPQAAPVTGTLYNTSGQSVAQYSWGMLESGSHRLSIHRNTLASGTYLLQCKVGRETITRSITLLR